MRDHLSQVLATFALILILNDGVRWSGAPTCRCRRRQALAGPVELLPGLHYPAYRLLIIAVGLLLALLLYLLVAKTRLGALVRAGASNREMALAMGVDIKRLFTLVFGIGAALCAVAGALLGPLLAVQVGMGENILILAFVVIVIGGIGSIRGALVGALLVGCVDTLGRTLLQHALREVLPPQWASAAGPAIASIAVYVLMAVVLSSSRRACFRRGADGRRRPHRPPRRRGGAARVRRVPLPWAPAARWRMDFYISVASRMLVYAIAATSLNLVLGYGGHGVVRPCGVRRPRRLCHRHADQRRRGQRPAGTCWRRWRHRAGGLA